MKAIDPGHTYELTELGGGTQKIQFIKRSGDAVQYDHEHPGLQVQEVLRMLIDRTKYLNAILPCVETDEALQHLRMALFMYEVRAYRRKQEEVNRKQPSHDDTVRPKSWTDNPYADVPFNEFEIENRPIGKDGHILL